MFPRASHGFTLVELVMVIVILGVMSAIVAPKLMDNSDIQAHGFADQVKASLRYAQKTAIAQRGHVCVAFTPSSITLTICPATRLASADGKLTSVVDAPSGITFSPIPTDFSFDALGRLTYFDTPDKSMPDAQTISINGVSTITVERETGYVH